MGHALYPFPEEAGSAPIIRLYYGSVAALSDSLELSDGTTQTSQDDTTAAADDTDWTSETSKWVSVTGHEITAQVAQAQAGEAVETSSPVPEAAEGLQVASVSYITTDGYKIKLNQYAPIQSPATGNITFHLRFDKYTVAIGSVTLVDGQTGQTKYQWSKARIYKSERQKYGFTIPARQGDVLVIGERHVDTIWGPTFNY